MLFLPFKPDKKTGRFGFIEGFFIPFWRKGRNALSFPPEIPPLRKPERGMC